MKALKKIFNFYFDTFRNMTKLEIRVIAIILIKLFIMFAILKIFFFPDFLGSKFENNNQKSNYILNQLTK